MEVAAAVAVAAAVLVLVGRVVLVAVAELTDIALRDDVKKELDITESQAGDIQKIADESRSGAGEDIRARFATFRDMSDEERQEAMQKLQEERQKQQLEVRKDVLAVLNSRQRDRFEQIEFQYYIDRGNAESAIAAANMELSEADREKLRDAQRNMQNELQARTAEIRRELQMEVLESVVSKSKIESLMGEKFTFEAGNGPQFGRGGGRRGGGAAAAPAGGQNRRRGQTARPSSEEESDDSSSGTTPRNRRRDR